MKAFFMKYRAIQITKSYTYLRTSFGGSSDELR